MTTENEDMWNIVTVGIIVIIFAIVIVILMFDLLAKVS